RGRDAGRKVAAVVVRIGAAVAGAEECRGITGCGSARYSFPAVGIPIADKVHDVWIAGWTIAGESFEAVNQRNLAVGAAHVDLTADVGGGHGGAIGSAGCKRDQ